MTKMIRITSARGELFTQNLGSFEMQEMTFDVPDAEDGTPQPPVISTVLIVRDDGKETSYTDPQNWEVVDA